jgi:hypothetical protein
VGYKLYWAEGDQGINYESASEKLGNVTEVLLPDDVKSFAPQSGPIKFGITAIDELGNESDFITLNAPYQFNAPRAPGDFWIEGVGESPAPPKAQTPNPAASSPTQSRQSMKENAAPTPKVISAPIPGMGGVGRPPNQQKLTIATRQGEDQP